MLIFGVRSFPSPLLLLFSQCHLFQTTVSVLPVASQLGRLAGRVADGYRAFVGEHGTTNYRVPCGSKLVSVVLGK